MALLIESHPDVYAQMVNPDPTITHGSDRRELWRCEDGHEWEATVANRAKGRGCPYCSGHRATDENRLATQRPDLYAELKVKDYELCVSSRKKVWWVCEDGHEWESTVDNRAKGSGCPYCSGHRTTDENRLATQRPDLYEELKVKDYELAVYSNKKVWWCVAKMATSGNPQLTTGQMVGDVRIARVLEPQMQTDSPRNDLTYTQNSRLRITN